MVMSSVLICKFCRLDAVLLERSLPLLAFLALALFLLLLLAAFVFLLLLLFRFLRPGHGGYIISMAFDHKLDVFSQAQRSIACQQARHLGLSESVSLSTAVAKAVTPAKACSKLLCAGAIPLSFSESCTHADSALPSPCPWDE